MLKVAYIGGSWSSNIGNAFYNLGTGAILSSIDKVDSYFIPDPPHWKEHVNNDFDIIGNLDVDLVILTGPCLNLKLPKIFSRSFARLTKRGVRLGFLSAGMSLYDEGEAKAVKNFLEQFKPSFIFTRDRDTYEFLKILDDVILYDGLCTSMFLNNALKVPDLALERYYVFNFDGNKEPFIELTDEGYYRIHNPRRKPQDNLNGLPIIRTDNRSITDGYNRIYSSSNVYHSDLPYGYLSILKGAEVVFSERVHTCASTLILGGTALFVPVAKRSFEKRSRLFDRLGIPDIFEQPSRLDFKYIESEKAKMKQAFVDVLSSM